MDNSFNYASKHRMNFSLIIYALAWIGLLFSALVFYINEFKQVFAYLEIRPIKNLYIPVSCEASYENDDRVVHIDCPLHKFHTFYPPAEFSRNIKPFRGVFFDIKIEMYQWVWRPSSFRFFFQGKWTSNLEESKKYPFFLKNTHPNPDFFPYIASVGRHFAPQIVAGDFILSRRHLSNFRGKQQLPLINDDYYVKPEERPCTSVSYKNTHVYDNALYTGDPLKPQIGDLRITFWGSTASHVSAIGKQVRFKTPLAMIHNQVELKTIINDTMFPSRGIPELVYEGDHTVDSMFYTYIRNRTSTGRFERFVSGVIFFIFLVWVMILTRTGLNTFPKNIHYIWSSLLLDSIALCLGIMSFTYIPFQYVYNKYSALCLFFISLILLSLGLTLSKHGLSGIRRSHNDYESLQSRKAIHSTELVTNDESGPYIYQPV